jgi:cytochrome c biogenesis protein ResB
MVSIYQSNWGKFSQISFNNEPITLPLENFRGEDIVILPLGKDVGLKLKVVQVEDVIARRAKPDEAISQKQYRSGEIASPSARNDILELYSISNDGSKQKYLGKVEKNKKLQLGPMNIGYFGTQTLTGLQFKSNPGSILIYPGLFFIILGVFIAFGSRKQIWARVNESNNKIVIGGNSDRSKRKFFQEFEEIISSTL